MGFPGGSDGKVSAYNVGDPSLVPGLGRSSGGGNGNPIQYSFLENSMDGGAQSIGVAKSQTQLGNFSFSFTSLIHTYINISFHTHFISHTHRNTSVLSGSVTSDSVILWTVAYQAPLSMGFSRQEHWNGCCFLLQGIFPTQ